MPQGQPSARASPALTQYSQRSGIPAALHGGAHNRRNAGDAATGHKPARRFVRIRVSGTRTHRWAEPHHGARRCHQRVADDGVERGLKRPDPFVHGIGQRELGHVSGQSLDLTGRGIEGAAGSLPASRDCDPASRLVELDPVFNAIPGEGEPCRRARRDRCLHQQEGGSTLCLRELHRGFEVRGRDGADDVHAGGRGPVG